MLGTIIGDIVGSAYEKRNHRSKDFSPFFHEKSRFTDDTVCTIGIADALLNGTKPAATLQTWCRRYEDNGGWGQRFAMWIFDDEAIPYGSYGNGAAMRVSPVGLLARTEQEASDWADYMTVITHNHDEAIVGARAVALAIFLARKKETAPSITGMLTERFGYDLKQTPDEIRPSYKHTERSSGSVPQAIVCALQSTSFEDALRNAVSIGGDSDTIAAIAGGIAEALHGIPEEIATQAWTYLPKDMRVVLNNLYSATNNDES